MRGSGAGSGNGRDAGDLVGNRASGASNRCAWGFDLASDEGHLPACIGEVVCNDEDEVEVDNLWGLR